MAKWIAFIRAKSFYVQAYQRLRPLSGSRPMVVVRDSRVLEACPRAEMEGVRVGMPLRQAQCVCPRADVVTFSDDDCRLLYRKLWDTAASYSPVVEPIDLHQGFADISKVVKDDHQAAKWQNEVRKQIRRRTKVEPLIGVGPNRFIARIAADVNAVVSEESIAEFIVSIPLSELGWIDAKLVEGLEQLGLTSLSEVVGVGRNALVSQVGVAGGQLYDWITGNEDPPVQPLYPPREERVAHTFDGEDAEQVILHVLEGLCERLADKLRNNGNRAHRLTLQVADLVQLHTATQPCSRPLKEYWRLYQVAMQLLVRLWEGQPLFAIQVVAEDLQRLEGHQLSLWSSRRRERIDEAVRAVHRRYGMRAVSKASQLKDNRRFAQMVLAAEGRFNW